MNKQHQDKQDKTAQQDQAARPASRDAGQGTPSSRSPRDDVSHKPNDASTDHTRGGSSEQHAAAGRQSHKNDQR